MLTAGKGRRSTVWDYLRYLFYSLPMLILLNIVASRLLGQNILFNAHTSFERTAFLSSSLFFWTATSICTATWLWIILSKNISKAVIYGLVALTIGMMVYDIWHGTVFFQVLAIMVMISRERSNQAKTV